MKNGSWFYIERIAGGYLGYGKCGTFFGLTRMAVITQLLTNTFNAGNKI